MDFNKILEFAEDKTVQLSDTFKDLLGTELQLGMSNYVIKHGSLSEGFEKLLPHQRYYQAIREMWTLGGNIKHTKAVAMEWQAKLQLYKTVNKLTWFMPIIGVYTASKLMQAESALTSLLVTIEDQVRQLKAFNDVRVELVQLVRSKYKNIEESEPESWDAVLKYRILRNKFGHKDFINHVPGSSERKAKIGLEFDNPEATIWLAIEKEKEIDAYHKGNMVEYLRANNVPVNVIQLRKDKKHEDLLVPPRH